MGTFQKEIRYQSKELVGTHFQKVKKKRTVTFNELDETEQSQHRLHFRIMSLYKSKMSVVEGEETQVQIDTDTLYDITVESIKKLVVLDEGFREIDLKEFLACSLATLKFGLWFLEEHILPFIKEYKD